MKKKIVSGLILLLALSAVSIRVHAQDDGFGTENDPGGNLPPVVVTPPPPPPPPDPPPSIPAPDPCQLNPCSCNPQSCGAPPENPCVTNPCSCSPACNAAPPPPTGSVPPITVPAGNNKPLLENKNKCTGIQDMWNAVTASTSNPEGFGYITGDGQFIFTATTGSTGGAVGTLYPYTNPSTNITTYYYSYPMSQGAPSGTYAGMTSNGTNYYIPVVATVHTHNECLVDHTNGIDQNVSASDQALANAYPAMKNYVIGCGAVGSYGSGDDTYNVQFGTPTSDCSFFQ